MNYKVSSRSFKQFVATHLAKFPLVVEVQEGWYGTDECKNISAGEIYRLESVNHLVSATFPDVSGVSKELTLPLNFEGRFQPLTRIEGKKKIGNVVKGLPCIVFPRHEITVQNVIIPIGTRIELCERNNKGLLICKFHFAQGKPKVMILKPDIQGCFDVGLSVFSKTYSLHELLELMPVLVTQSRTEEEIQTGVCQISGLPADFQHPILLSRIDMINCRPSTDISKIIQISIDTEVTVNQVFDLDHLFHTDEIQNMIRIETNFPFCVEVVDFNVGIKSSPIFRSLELKQLLIVEHTECTRKAVVKGKKNCFTIPVEKYNGTFVMVPNVFQTADEIWQEHYTKKVRVMEDYIVSSPHIDSIFAGDVLTAKEMKVISYEQQECEVIICSRESAIPELPTLVRIPSYALGGFEEVDYHKESFTLDSIPRELPISARLHGNPYQRKHNEDDKLLLEEAPLTFEVIFTEMNILVSVFDEIKNSTTHRFFIPEHKLVRVKKRNMPTGYKPRSHHNQKERLMIDLLSEKDFNSMCVTYREYQKPPQIPPPIPPRQSTLPRRQTNRASYKSSDSEDDDYEMPFVARENSHKEPVDKK
ncbi:uncharacterized protein LOC117118273 isoform X2 [Anneissia japonica]|uniref:uncharacterized protein LOC117118273 isoform X2 n=1 Tax=Anneissia japonica TaxID=1529436 RepID=UPI0014259DE2|nr:uncharacterized protein LOC117118273 isoform X2 [Anneissia japonica]